MSRIVRQRGRYLRTVSSLWWMMVPAFALPVGAAAQTAVDAPAVRETVDANGVDLVQGAFNTSATDVSIGPAGSHGLAFSRSWEGNGWRNNLSSGISGSTQTPVVTIGNSSDSFTLQNGAYVPNQGNGATLVVDGSSGDYIYTSGNGTSARFLSTPRNAFLVNTDAGIAYVKSVTNPDGVVTSFNYDTLTYCYYVGDFSGETTACSDYARLGSVTNNVGYKLKLAYRTDDNSTYSSDWFALIKVTAINTTVPGCDPNADSCGSVGAWPSATYDDASMPSAVTGPGGRVAHYSYDGNGRLTGMRRPGARQDDVTIGYDGNGRVQTIGRVGSTWTYAYDYNSASQRQTVITTNPDNTHRTFIADMSIAEPLSSTNEVGAPTSYLFNTQGQLGILTLPEGNEKLYNYDARGNTIQISDTSKASISDSLTTTAKYEDSCSNVKTCNQPLWTRDALGNQTDYQYDPTHGGVTVVTAPAAASGVRPQVRYGYTGYGAQDGGTIYMPTSTSACRTQGSCGGSGDEVVTTTDYGSLSNNLLPVSRTKRAGDNSLAATVSASYDAIGNAVTSTDPLGARTILSYDPDREITEVISADPDGGGPLKPRAVRVNHNGDGTVGSTEIGTDTGGNFQTLQTASTGYDGYGRQILASTSAGGSTLTYQQWLYDGLGRVRCQVQRMNAAAFGNQSDSCKLGPEGSDGPDRISVTDYDGASRPIAITSAFGTAVATTERLSYTANGKTASVMDANGNVTGYSYDRYDRASRTSYPSPSTGAGQPNGGDYEQLGYDVASNVLSRRLRDGQVLTYDYDALGRRTYDHNPQTTVAEANVSYSYDLLGELTRAQDGNGWYSAYVYDALGRATTVSSNLASNTLGYDLAGRRVSQTWADGFFVTYEYDVLGEMTAVREDGSSLLATLYYNDLGQRTGLARPNLAETTYSYSGAYLTGMSHDLAGTANDLTIALGYNAAGQINSRATSNDAYSWTGQANVVRPYAVNGLNQYTQSGSVTPSYDARGNLTQAGGSAYSYNTQNLLYSSGAGTLYYHGPSGALGQIIRGDGTGQNLDYVGSQLATEFDFGGGGQISRRYVYIGPDEPLMWYEGPATGDRRYLHTDERGSVIAVTDGGGNPIAINTYDEFGIPGANNLGRFQYTGQKWIPELGLYDYKARMYSPSLGRFMQTDPIGYGDGLNWYNYVGGDPVNLIDPTGLDQCFDNGRYTIHEGSSSTTGEITVTAPLCGGFIDLPKDGGQFYPGFNGGGGFPGVGDSPLPTLPQTPQKSDPKQDCGLLAALSKNKQALIGDFIGLAASALPGGKPAVALAGLALGAGILTNTALTSSADRPGLSIGSISLGIAGIHVTSAGPLAEGFEATSFIARNLPGIGAIIAGGALVLDAANVYQDYKACPK